MEPPISPAVGGPVDSHDPQSMDTLPVETSCSIFFKRILDANFSQTRNTITSEPTITPMLK